MFRLHKKLFSALCGIFFALVLCSVGSPVYGSDYAADFPRNFNYRNLIRATDSEESLEFCAFCGHTRGEKSAYVISFNVPGLLNLEDSRIFDGSITCLPSDLYNDGKAITDSVNIYEVYESSLIEDTVGFLSVYYTESFDKKYFSQLGDMKMAPLSTLSEGDKVFMTTFDSPTDIVSDYGYVDSIQKSDHTFIVNTNYEWLNNNSILWIGAPVVNKKGECVGVLLPIDQEDPNQAMVYALDEAIDYLEDECGFSIYDDGSGGYSDKDNKDDYDEDEDEIDNRDDSEDEDRNDWKNDKKDDKNMETKSVTPFIIILIVLLVIGTAVGIIFFISRRKNNSSAAPPVYPQNYVQPPVNQFQGYNQPPENQPQGFNQPPVNQPQDYNQPPQNMQVSADAPVENYASAGQQNYQMFNSQDSLDINQVPATTFVNPNLTLRCVGGTLNGNSYPIADNLCIGRNPALCNVVFPEGEPGVSNIHCKITQTNGQVQLTDMGSSAGTYINGVQILPNVPYPMPSGSSFYLGSPANTFIIAE